MSNAVLRCLSCGFEYRQYRPLLKNNTCFNCQKNNSKVRQEIIHG